MKKLIKSCIFQNLYILYFYNYGTDTFGLQIKNRSHELATSVHRLIKAALSREFISLTNCKSDHA